MTFKTFRASIIAEGIASIIQGERTFCFHSVFTEALNLSVGNTLITFQSSSIFLTPQSIVVQLPENFSFRDYASPGFDYRVEGNLVYINPLVTVRIDCAKLWKPLDLIGADFRSMDILGSLYILDERISHAKVNSGFAAVLNSMFQLPRKHRPGQEELFFGKHFSFTLENAYAAWIKRDVGSAAKILSTLVGMGPGLTPSGDDFLVGMIAALYALKGKSAILEFFLRMLKKEVKGKSHGTNDISRSFLMYSIQGQVSKPLGCLLAALAERNIEEISKYCDQLINYGHSSGVDTLCGVVCALRFAQNNDLLFVNDLPFVSDQEVHL